MSKIFSIGYDDVQSIIDAGPEDAWVSRELGEADLSDKRLNRRLIKVTQDLAKSPLSPINEACGNWASTQAAYRLFGNAKTDAQEILRPHKKETLKRMISYNGTVLAIQDTVFMSYGQHPKTRGLGPIGKGESSGDRGLIMHNAIAFTTSGVPLGILSQRTWARQEVPDESREEKIKRLQHTSTDEKESSKWLLALDETIAMTPPHIKVVTIADREVDFFEFITRAEGRALYLIRAKTDRKLVAEESDDCECMSAALAAAPVAGVLSVHIPSNGKRKERDATVEIKFAEVTLKPPQKRGDAKASGSIDPVTVTVISACETHPPQGAEAISWVLITNLPIESYDDAVEKIAWYTKRWGIEIWHKVLKSGCKVEDCLLETAERLTRFLAIFSIIACRLLYITYLARTNPDAPATSVFSECEVSTIYIRATKTIIPQGSNITLRDAVRMIGGLGGHLGRKCDGEPGITVLWRGMVSLYESIETLHAYKTALAIDTS
jgi:hypothetical protein